MNDLAVIQYNVTDAAIALMESEYLPLKINGIDDKAGFAAVHEARMVVKGYRVGVEKTRRNLNAEALAWTRKVNEEAKRITGKLEPIEAHLEKEETAVTEEKARIKAEAERKERERVDGIRAKIAGMSRKVLDTQGKSAAEIQKMILDFSECHVTTEEFQEFVIEAAKVATETMEALVSACESRWKWEGEQAAAKAESERLAKIQAEQEAERKRLADEKAAIEAEKAALEKAKREEKERHERAELEARLREEAKAKAEAELKAKAEREVKEAAERAEKERIEKERQEALKPDKEKIINYVNAVFRVPHPDFFHTDDAKQIFTAAGDGLSRWGKKLTKQAEAL